MDFRFGKPLEFRLSRLETDPVRIPTQTLRDMYGRRFKDESPFFERLLAGHYDAGFQFYNNEDILYTFRNESEIAFAGYFPSPRGRADTALLGISAHGQSAQYDTPTLATPHKPVAELVYAMRKGILVVDKPDMSFVPDVELYASETNFALLVDMFEPMFSRFDGLEYGLKVPERPALRLEKP